MDQDHAGYAAGAARRDADIGENIGGPARIGLIGKEDR